MNSDKSRLDMNTLKQGASVGAVGLEMGISVITGFLIGHYLDKWLDTSPIFTIIWIGFGFGAAAKALIRTYKYTKKVIGDNPEDKSENH
jgi:F0F1-type ATP synthase assembly protein I